MNNLEKYRSLFKESFQYTGDVEGLAYQAIPEWDSVGHMQLMAGLEDCFGIELDVETSLIFPASRRES